jgi:hypothetical protein
MTVLGSALDRLAAVLLSIACAGLVGCDTPPRQGPREAPSAPAASAVAAAGGGGSGSAPVAMWRDRTLTWDELRPALVELGGAIALEDAFLDLRIAQALAERSIRISDAAIEEEKAILLATLDPDPNVATRLLQEIRARQGLGTTRFQALLARNAGLRALVQPDVRITPDALARQHDVLHGSKRTARVIAVQTLAEAEDVRRLIEGGADFAAVAAQRSTDASAARGGLLAPISASDPSWPDAFRTALFRLQPGELSPATVVEDDYLIIRLVEERPADGVSLDAARTEVERTLRRAQERVLMEERARGYLREIQPTIYDESLSRAWRQRPE